MAGCKEITLILHHAAQVKSLRPLLLARKCMLMVEAEPVGEAETGSMYEAETGAVYEAGTGAVYEAGTGAVYEAGTGAVYEAETGAVYEAESEAVYEADHDSVDHEAFCLYFMKTEGFDDVFVKEEIDFDAYDARFARVHDAECKLLMALARILYPHRLSEKARADYEAFLKKRAYPAQTLLVSGIFDRYGLLPERCQEVLNLKKPDKYIARELIKQASGLCKDRWVEALLADAPAPGDGLFRDHALQPGDVLFREAEILFIRRCPEFSGCLAAMHERLSVLYMDSTALKMPESMTDAVRLLAHILFHELFAVWSETNLTDEEGFTEGQADAERSLMNRDNGSRCPANRSFDSSAGHPLLFSLAADIAAEYQVDEHLGYKADCAWARQKIYDTIKREYQFREIFSASPGTCFLTVREAYAFVNGLNPDDNPLMLSYLQKLFTIDDVHPIFSVENTGKMGNKTEFSGSVAEELSHIGEGLDQSGSRKAHGLRSAAGSARKDAVGETADLKKREGHDYKDFLRQFMVSGETRILDLDSFDPVYYTLGLREYHDMPFVEPLETKEVLRLDELVIVIDTSGSCSGPMVRFFLEETWSVFSREENFFDRFHVHILQCDAMVQQDTLLTTLEEAGQYMANMMIHGGGNTDFRPAFRYIKKLQREGGLRRLKGIIYFTDGYGTFPQKADAPACKTVFVSLRKQFDQVEVPVWAERLLLDPPANADWATQYSGEFHAKGHL